MCEPTHSICQVDPTNPETGDPINVDKIFGHIGDWMRKVMGYFHFSKFGAGHSEGLQFAKNHHGRVPEPTRWEAIWWERRVKLDGEIYFPNGQVALYPDETYKKSLTEAATEYANLSSIGSLSVFRRFFETSMRKTDSPYLYLEAFQYMLNRQGRLAFDNRRRKAGIKSLYAYDFPIDRILKVCLGLTRKRELLVPEWADDSSLWQPSSPRLVGV